MSLGQLQVPRPLTQGDRVALVAPARFASEELVKQGMALLESWGLQGVVHPNTRLRHHQFGGTDDERATALTAAFRDPEIRAIWALRGGYGCTRLLPLLQSEAFQHDPKWVVGFSDITALHGWATNLGVASLHAPVISTSTSTDSTDLANMRRVILGEALPDVQKGRRIVGGNLSVLFAMLGTPSFPALKGRWLLLEDVDEYLYHLDRMLVAMGQAGVWNQVEGVMVGTFTDMRDNTVAFGQLHDNPFGRSVREILESHLGHLPVEWDVPVGHGRRNAPVILG
ncbi:MAG: LD-carboxypeptidase [Bacteroidetes bacterium]|nr:LD-carboxypeptidase [Bacteroidota bacterium]MDA0904410.1 LD-carboxypeptidase [Bacteroidota bacterium]MDA1243348.1 LD-carboxypeptidase [Bacteroidota bacterium]